MRFPERRRTCRGGQNFRIDGVQNFWNSQGFGCDRGTRPRGFGARLRETSNGRDERGWYCTQPSNAQEIAENSAMRRLVGRQPRRGSGAGSRPPLERKCRSYSTEASHAPVVGFRGVRSLFRSRWGKCDVGAWSAAASRDCREQRDAGAWSAAASRRWGRCRTPAGGRCDCGDPGRQQLKGCLSVSALIVGVTNTFFNASRSCSGVHQRYAGGEGRRAQVSLMPPAPVHAYTQGNPARAPRNDRIPLPRLGAGYARCMAFISAFCGDREALVWCGKRLACG
jgi:hypothetical protein